MASTQSVETSVPKNSPSQDSNHPDDLFQSRYVTPGFKPFSYLVFITFILVLFNNNYYFKKDGILPPLSLICHYDHFRDSAVRKHKKQSHCKRRNRLLLPHLPLQKIALDLYTGQKLRSKKFFRVTIAYSLKENSKIKHKFFKKSLAQK